jgi:hypothetical protein
MDDAAAAGVVIGLVLHAGGGGIPCRTPKMGGNPAAKAVIAALS